MYRQQQRGGRPAMPHVDRGRMGMATMRANARKRKLAQELAQAKEKRTA